MKVKISKYMSYINLFVGSLLVVFYFINELSPLYLVIGIFALLTSSASIYLKRKIALQEKKEDKKQQAQKLN